MKRVLTDHGAILHWMGGHHLFPVRGSGGELGFASHGALEGRTPIGWHEFFPVLRRTDAVVVVDDDEGSAEVLPRTRAPAPGPAPADKPAS